MNNQHTTKRFQYTLNKGWLLRLLAAVLLAGCLVTAFAQDEDEDEGPFHDLKGQTLCVDSSSVLVSFDNVDSTRIDKAKAKLLSPLKDNLKRTLSASNVTVEFPTSCSGRDGFVVVFARVTFLDPTTYKHYGKQAFGLTLSVQTGKKADATYLVSHNVLPELRFGTIDEVAFSEFEQRKDFESYLTTEVNVLLTELVQAWHTDNP